MRLVRLSALLVGLLALSTSLSAQDTTKKADPKDPPKTEPKAKGFLPMNWAKLGLSEEQRTKVYQVQGKYNDQIDKLEAQIKELKDKMAKERLDVLTPEQRKRLADILLGKAGGTEK